MSVPLGWGLEFAVGGPSGGLLGGVGSRAGGHGEQRPEQRQALGDKSGIIFIPLFMAHGPGLTMPSVPPSSAHPGRPRGSLWSTWGEEEEKEWGSFSGLVSAYPPCS